MLSKKDQRKAWLGMTTYEARPHHLSPLSFATDPVCPIAQEEVAWEQWYVPILLPQSPIHETHAGSSTRRYANLSPNKVCITRPKRNLSVDYLLSAQSASSSTGTSPRRCRRASARCSRTPLPNRAAPSSPRSPTRTCRPSRSRSRCASAVSSSAECNTFTVKVSRVRL
jgi:hypothetical protein